MSSHIGPTLVSSDADEEEDDILVAVVVKLRTLRGTRRSITRRTERRSDRPIDGTSSGPRHFDSRDNRSVRGKKI